MPRRKAPPLPTLYPPLPSWESKLAVTIGPWRFSSPESLLRRVRVEAEKVLGGPPESWPGEADDDFGRDRGLAFYARQIHYSAIRGARAMKMLPAAAGATRELFQAGLQIGFMLGESKMRRMWEGVVEHAEDTLAANRSGADTTNRERAAKQVEMVEFAGKLAKSDPEHFGRRCRKALAARVALKFKVSDRRAYDVLQKHKA